MLVNNTGINPVQGPLVELDQAAARKIFEVNCLAALAYVGAHRAKYELAAPTTPPSGSSRPWPPW
jgi:NAD(P)-dependent dehydrogenase (short-subunit alcohol dehydrogenase family)